MNIGIIGTGNIGAGLARHFVRLGHTVHLSNSRGPDSLKDLVAELGPRAEADSTANAVAHGEIVLLAMPWGARHNTYQSAGGAGAFAGKIVVDAMNPYTEYPEVEDLAGRAASEVVASELPDARLVKAFNTIQAATLANGGKPPGDPARIALPVCGDDADATKTVSGMIEALGFDAVDAGGLSGSQFQEPRQPLYDKDYPASKVREVLQSR